MQGKRSCMQLKEMFNRTVSQIGNWHEKGEQRIKSNLNEKQNMLQEYLNEFENELQTINRSKQKESIKIQRLKQDLRERYLKSELIEKASIMQQGLVQKERESIQQMQQFKEWFVEGMRKYESLEHRQELQLQKYHRKRQQNRIKTSCKIELDKQHNKIRVNIDQAKGRVYQIFYNKRQDRFWVSDSNRVVIQAVDQFNFHRNIRKLYQKLLLL